MTTFQRIMTELTYGRSTDYVRRVARKERNSKALDSTEYKAITRTCHVVDLVRGKEWRM